MHSAVKTHLYLDQSQPANADWNLERSNHACVIVSNIENIIRLFGVFGGMMMLA